MRKVVLYIHGKNGSAFEAEHYQPFFTDADVIGFDYQSQTPWKTNNEFIEKYQKLAEQYEKIIIIANSIGAYFSMNAPANKKIERAFFISPIVDMEKLICDMMQWSGITEQELAFRKEIATSFGETLSWDYLCYVRAHPIEWNIPTDILYGQNDNLTPFDTISAFAEKHFATLTVMPNGEHWFHTEEQMSFLDNWLKNCLKQEK